MTKLLSINITIRLGNLNLVSDSGIIMYCILIFELKKKKYIVCLRKEKENNEKKYSTTN